MLGSLLVRLLFLVEIDYKKELKLRIESVGVLEQNKTEQILHKYKPENV